ncbi:hypothetical protein SLEP1_g6954 [Rubroshorea leprosula]|uniref:Uncharacterized protein n=1 Tax=Rubroshorea leprosula TaxID=152421 RepID=A0AAV5HWU5_9ROSI|nr:hypothetical protein SLEP1_g6954 [Rubroshorea leprosula]
MQSTQTRTVRKCRTAIPDNEKQTPLTPIVLSTNPIHRHLTTPASDILRKRLRTRAEPPSPGSHLRSTVHPDLRSAANEEKAESPWSFTW